MRRIGLLMSAVENEPRALENITAFAHGLAELGWTVGRNVRIEYRLRADNAERTIAAGDAQRPPSHHSSSKCWGGATPT